MDVVVESAVVDVVGWSGDTFLWRSESRGHADFEGEDGGSTDVWRAVHGERVDLAGRRAIVRLGWEHAGTWEGLVGPPPQEPAGLPPEDPAAAVAFHALERVAARHHPSSTGFAVHVRGLLVDPDQPVIRLGEDDVGEVRAPPRRTPVLSWDRSGFSNPVDLTYRTCAERPRTVLSADLTGAPYVGDPLAFWVRAWPRPGGGWTALVLSQDGYFHFRAGRMARTGAVVLVATGPETQLLHPAGMDGARLQDLAAKLAPEAVVTHVGPAQADRAESVVYAAAGWERAAQEVARRLPGGAAVAPLTWRVPDACLVIALGRSAEAAWR